MRKLYWMLFLAAVGCRGKSEADTGQEFVEKFSKAAGAKDIDTLWALLSQDSQGLWLNSANERLDRAKNDKVFAQRIKVDLALDAEVTDLQPIALAKILLQKERKQDIDNWGSLRLIEVGQDGGNVLISVEVPGKGRRDWILVREKKYLRLDWFGSKL